MVVLNLGHLEGLAITYHPKLNNIESDFYKIFNEKSCTTIFSDIILNSIVLF